MQKKQFVLRVLVGVLALTLLNISAFGVMKGNDSEGAFDTPDAPGAESVFSATVSVSMKQNIVQGACYFMQSYSDSLLFLDKIEQSELTGADYSEMQKRLTGAIEKMEKARSTYSNLKEMADVTPYNLGMIYELWFFDYQSLQAKNTLNSVIFLEVQNYLRKGDVRGVYAKMRLNTIGLLNLLNKIKNDVDAGKLPALSYIWKLNQSYSEAMLFGQYVAEVFCTISGKD